MASKLLLKPNPTLADLQQYVRESIKERGFGDKPEDMPKRFVLLTEESGEFTRAVRKVVGMKFAADTKKSEISEEAADLFIIFLGLCNLLGIDLEQAFRDKEENNKKRIWK